MDSLTTRHEETPCRTCGKTLDASTRLDGSIPAEGDISVCGYCGELSLFNADLTMRAPTAEEHEEIMQGESG